MEWLLLLLGACVGSAANRIRGGFLTDRFRVGGQFQRLIYAALMAALMLGAMAASG
jgi:hypothetical protein